MSVLEGRRDCISTGRWTGLCEYWRVGGAMSVLGRRTGLCQCWMLGGNMSAFCGSAVCAVTLDTWTMQLTVRVKVIVDGHGVTSCLEQHALSVWQKRNRKLR